MLSHELLTKRATRLTWIAWGVFFLAACLVLAIPKDRRQASAAYARGAERWRNALDLYDEGGKGFIYLPPSAVLYVPFSLLPRYPQDVLWRLVTIGLFAAGVYQFCRMAGEERGSEYFPLVSLLVLPKTWTCAVNGQATPALAGLSMLALAAIHRQKWGRAALFLAAALAFKPLAIVLILLVAALYPPMRSRLSLGIAVFFAVPYLTQSPDYVTEQYRASVDMLRDAAEIGREVRWAHLFSLGKLLGIELAPTWETVVRVLAALATLAVCWRVCRSKSEIPASKSEIPNPNPEISPWPLIYLYALATSYLLLFNPRTENNSYLMLSPAIAVFCVRAWSVEHRAAKAGWLCAAAVVIFAGHDFCAVVTPQSEVVWVCPLVGLAFAAGLIREVMTSQAPETNEPNSRLG
jgi:alpha-1,2-mannosyltransferase